MAIAIWTAVVGFAAACRSASGDDLATLSDEFDDPNTAAEWKRIFEVEQWGADQLEKFDLGKTQVGWLALIPYASAWHRDYRGELVFKEVTGDFVVTSHVHASRRGDAAAPRSPFSLAGLMVRTPRDVTPRSWRPGDENYVSLSIGAAREAGEFAFEAKSTLESVSTLTVEPTSSGDALVQIARIGDSILLLKRPARGEWSVDQRYSRMDLPATLQVGVTVYSDYPRAVRMSPEEHNRTVIHDGAPDLVAGFDYVRFRRPSVPADLLGREFSDPQSVSDERLLKFLGEASASRQSTSP